MFRPASRHLAYAACAVLFSAPFIQSQPMAERVMSEHVRIRVPVEREWLGRDTIMDMERCYLFMNAATGDNLPRKIVVVIDFSGLNTRTSYADSTISVGMAQPAAVANERGFLLHSSAREMARLGLYTLSRGGIESEECEFLVEGMAEILVHEYERNSRSLNGAWVISQMLDKLKLLGMNAQTAWTTFSGGRHDLRAAAPGITFLITCRQAHGRDRILKLFEGLRRGSVHEGFALAFRSSPEALEAAWLKRVRSYQDNEDITVTAEEDAPQLLKAVPVPDVVKAGSSLQLQLFLRDKKNDLPSQSVFLQDETSGNVLQAQPAQGNEPDYIQVVIPVEAGRKPGDYNYRVTAVDEAGNIRHWDGKYAVTY